MSSTGIPVKVNEQKVHEHFGSILYMDEKDPGHYYTSAAAVTELGNAYPAGVQGYKITSETPDWVDCPFLLKTTTENDLVVAAFKHRGEQMYYYGVWAEKVKEFRKPSSGSAPDVASLWVTMKVNSEMPVAVDNLTDTESAPLKANFEAILAVTPIFKENDLVTARKLSNWANRPYENNVKKVVTMAEMRERKTASAHAQGDAEQNKGGGAEAAARWKKVKGALLSHADYYKVRARARARARVRVRVRVRGLGLGVRC